MCEIPFKLVLPSHKISIGEDVLTPHFHRLPHTCYGKTLLFRYWRNLLHQQFTATLTTMLLTWDTRKRWSSFKWVAQVEPDLTVICHAHEWHHGLYSRTHEHLLHSYVGPYDTPILVRMSRSEVGPTHGLLSSKGMKMCFYAFIHCHLQWTTAVVMLSVLSLIANIRGCL